MGKLVVSLDGVVIKEVQITKDKTTLGRRPYNDIVIDNLAVSGEHAVLQMVGARCLHRRPEQHQRHLHQRQGHQEAAAGAQRHGRDRQVQDQVPDRRRRRLREDDDHAPGRDTGAALSATTSVPRRPPAVSNFGLAAGPASSGSPASIKVLNGAAAGREVTLDQGGHHGRQARRAGGVDHQAARRAMCSRMSKGSTARRSTACRWRANRCPAERRCHRTRRHADAVRPGLSALRGARASCRCCPARKAPPPPEQRFAAHDQHIGLAGSAAPRSRASFARRGGHLIETAFSDEELELARISRHLCHTKLVGIV